MYILISSNKRGENGGNIFSYVHLAFQVEKKNEKMTTVRNEE